MGASVVIICSDVTHNGKTLLARLFADLLSLRKPDSPIIFDTDGSGNGISNRYPDRARTIDLSKVGDQVALFDTMLEQVGLPIEGASVGSGPDFVIDVAASELSRFFQIFGDIGFERGAFEANLDVRIYYIIDWQVRSLMMAGSIQKALRFSRFIPVRNMYVEALPFSPTPQEEARLPDLQIGLFLHALSDQARHVVEQDRFSFADLISGSGDNLPYELKSEIWNFLEGVYDQVRA